MLRREEVRYSVGIATNGLEWQLIARDIEEGIRTVVVACSLVDPVKMVLEKAHLEVDPAPDWAPDARERVADTLVANFSRGNLLTTAVEGLDST